MLNARKISDMCPRVILKIKLESYLTVSLLQHNILFVIQTIISPNHHRSNVFSLLITVNWEKLCIGG